MRVLTSILPVVTVVPLLAVLVSAQVSSPPAAPVARLTEAGAVTALHSEIEARVASDVFAGAVLVAKNGKPIFQQAYGHADREASTPNMLDTKFRIGSMNKMFTAVAVAQLAQAGKIKLEDPIGKYLTGYPNRDVAGKVTIHNLLTHTGGTGDIFGPQFQEHREQLRELKDYVALYGARGPEFEPGAKWAYSNYGFILLGRIVEVVSGQSYYDYVREHIFKRAGMKATDSLPESVHVKDRSIGYTKEVGGWLRPNTDSLPPRGTSAGGGYSTVKDLLAFADALAAHRLLDPHYTELVTTGKVDAGPGGKYAYGFEDHNDGGARWFGHGGGAPGMNGALRVYPDSGYVVAVLANLDPPAAQDVSRFIGDRLPAK
jgi:D-alanyl-D-alanine carboxypeptidase